MSTLLSLFDYSGNWSLPYAENGWNVIRIDRKIKDADNYQAFNKDIMDIDTYWMYENIFDNYDLIDGVLAAPPCTDFAVSGAKHWKEKDKPKQTLFGTVDRLEYFTELTRQTLRIIDLCQPLFYAIENPVGRIAKQVPEIGKAWYFQPYWFGDNYSKKTGLYGKFNKPKPTNIVEPIKHSYGSKTQEYGGKSEKTKELRSITPLGFAYAFYEANNLKNTTMKKFFWKDKTGRGFTNTLTADDLLNMDDDQDWNNEFLHQFVVNAEEGDKWEDSSSEIICTNAD
jgi:hypothetical protein